MHDLAIVVLWVMLYYSTPCPGSIIFYLYWHCRPFRYNSMNYESIFIIIIIVLSFLEGCIMFTVIITEYQWSFDVWQHTLYHSVEQYHCWTQHSHYYQCQSYLYES